MYQQKRQRDYRSIWIASLVIIVIGAAFTFRLVMIRPLGYILLAVGGAGLIWSLVNRDKWNEGKDRNEPKHFN